MGQPDKIEYRILDFKNHNILVEFDDIRVNIVLPIIDGLYPEGDDLDCFIQTSIARIRHSNAGELTVVAENEAHIASLISSPTKNAVVAHLKKILFATDWTMLSDSELSDCKKEAWVSYRKCIRKLLNDGCDSSALFPVPPGHICAPSGVRLVNEDGSLSNVSQ